jgi:hypothetical protein
VRIYITIPIEVRIDGKAAAVLTTPEPHDLVASLTERLTRWDDGRYSFQTEMIAAGLHEAVQGAVSDVVHHDTPDRIRESDGPRPRAAHGGAGEQHFPLGERGV